MGIWNAAIPLNIPIKAENKTFYISFIKVQSNFVSYWYFSYTVSCNSYKLCGLTTTNEYVFSIKLKSWIWSLFFVKLAE